MAKIGEMLGLTLAILLAVFTFLGSFSGAALNKFLPDASTRRETSVELVKVAIGILTESEAEAREDDEAARALRKWAVDLINNNSEVEIAKELQLALIEGRISISAEVWPPPANSYPRTQPPDVETSD